MWTRCRAVCQHLVLFELQALTSINVPVVANRWAHPPSRALVFDTLLGSPVPASRLLTRGAGAAAAVPASYLGSPVTAVHRAGHACTGVDAPHAPTHVC